MASWEGAMKISNYHGIRILIVLAAIALAGIRFPAGWVEKVYSTGLYPHLAACVKPLTRWSPVPVLDVLLVTAAIGLPAWWIWQIRAAGAGRKWRAAGRAAFATLTLAAALVCAFELLWGLNYQRLPLTAKLDWDSKRVTPQAALALSKSAIEHLNAEVGAARGQPMPAAGTMARGAGAVLSAGRPGIGASPGFQRGGAADLPGQSPSGRRGRGRLHESIRV